MHESDVPADVRALGVVYGLATETTSPGINEVEALERVAGMLAQATGIDWFKQAQDRHKEERMAHYELCANEDCPCGHGGTPTGRPKLVLLQGGLS